VYNTTHNETQRDVMPGPRESVIARQGMAQQRPRIGAGGLASAAHLAPVWRSSLNASSSRHRHARSTIAGPSASGIECSVARRVTGHGSAPIDRGGAGMPGGFFTDDDISLRPLALSAVKYRAGGAMVAPATRSDAMTKKPAPDPLPPQAPAVEATDAIYVVPRHGGGRLRPFQPGQSGNPSGQSGRYGEVVRLCQAAGPEIAKALIEIALDRNEDTRARIVACQEILTRAFGRPKAEVKIAEGGSATLDASKLTDRELEILEKIALAAKPDAGTLQ
jgi:hypothetical protein